MKHLVEEVVLKNGSRGLLIDVPGANVMSFQFHFRAGNRYTRGHDVYETAHIMEHMAFGANAKYKDTQEYEADYTKNGAYHNAYTSDHSMVYHGDCADFEWDRILDLKQVAICSPRFNEEEFAAETGNVRNELNGFLNKHTHLLWPKIQQSLGEDILTFPERLKTVGNVTLKDVREHYRRTHTHENMRFVIAGRMDRRRTKIISMLESWELGHGERMSIPVDELHRQSPLLIRRKEATNVTFGWSINVPRRISDTEIDAMACANHILTGTMHSRIFGAARAKGLAYNIFSDASASEHTSSWDFGAEVNADTIHQVFDIITSEVKGVLNGNITEAEVDAAKQYALGRHQMGAQTVGQINRWYAERYFFDGTVEDYQARPKAIQGVAKSRIVETAREFTAASCWMLGVLGSTDKAFVDGLDDILAPVFD
jgi:predicted Zn-dependent peptidase